MSSNEYQVINYREALAQGAEAAAAVMTPSVNKISFGVGQISCDGNSIGSRIACYILAYRRVNTWYLNKYNPDKMESPQCWTVFKKEDEIRAAPDPRSSHPQCDCCVNCPKNAFGSSRDGRKGKDCANRWRLSIVPAGMPTAPGAYNMFDAAAVEAQPLYTCHVPVASGTNFSNYIAQISNPHRLGRASWGVVTEFEVVPDARTQFKLKFNFIAAPEDDNMLSVLFNKYQIADSEIEYGFEVSTETPAPQANATNKF